MLNQPDADDEAFIMGQMSDVAEKTYLVRMASIQHITAWEKRKQ